MLEKGKSRLHKANMFLGIEEIVFLRTINCYSAVYINRIKKEITKDTIK